MLEVKGRRKGDMGFGRMGGELMWEHVGVEIKWPDVTVITLTRDWGFLCEIEQCYLDTDSSNSEKLPQDSQTKMILPEPVWWMFSSENTQTCSWTSVSSTANGGNTELMCYILCGSDSHNATAYMVDAGDQIRGTKQPQENREGEY